MSQRNYTCELPTIPLLTIHMDNESPRGLDAIFQREAMLAAEMKESVIRKSWHISRSSELFSVDTAMKATRGLIDRMFGEGTINITQNDSTHQLLAIQYTDHVNPSGPVTPEPNFVSFMMGFRYDRSADKFFITASGWPDLVDQFANELPSLLEEKEVRSYDIDIVKIIDEKGEFSSRKIVIPIEKMDKPHIDFYPVLKRMGFTSIDEFEEAYMSSNKPLLILIGEGGGGKTTLMGWLAMRAKQKNRYMIQHDMPLMSCGFGPWLLGQGADTLIAIEDSDSKIMMERKRENNQMSAILNFCDGVGSYNNKLLISTNLESLRSVDSALIRVGRLWKAIEFGKLTPDEANQARAAIGKEPYEFTHDVTLAEAFSPEDMDNVHGMDSSKGGFGFTGSR